MAWISIHDSVRGSKLRRLQGSLGCSQNEAIGIIVKLWLWGIEHADEDGYVDGADRYVIEDVISNDLHRNLDAHEVVDALDESEWLKIGDRVRLIEWKENQMEWYREQANKERNRERVRKHREKKKKTDILPEKEAEPKKMAAQTEAKIDFQEKTQPTLHSKAKTQYTNDFEDFWKEYPRKKDKGSAYKKYNARMNDGWSPEELIAAAKNYASECIRERTEERFIKHPKTFLSDSTPFTDYLPKKKDSGQVQIEMDGNPFDMFRRDENG